MLYLVVEEGEEVEEKAEEEDAIEEDLIGEDEDEDEAENWSLVWAYLNPFSFKISL